MKAPLIINLKQYADVLWHQGMSVELKKIGIYSQHELGHSQGLDTPNKARDASTEPREAKLSGELSPP